MSASTFPVHLTQVLLNNRRVDGVDDDLMSLFGAPEDGV
jgi:hypothetical protein